MDVSSADVLNESSYGSSFTSDIRALIAWRSEFMVRVHNIFWWQISYETSWIALYFSGLSRLIHGTIGLQFISSLGYILLYFMLILYFMVFIYSYVDSLF